MKELIYKIKKALLIKLLTSLEKENNMVMKYEGGMLLIGKTSIVNDWDTYNGTMHIIAIKELNGKNKKPGNSKNKEKDKGFL